MKQYTPAIVGEIKKKPFFSLSRKSETRYYEATRESSGQTLLWIEMNALGAPMCYPCVIREPEKLMAFRGGLKQANKDMMAYWVTVIDAKKKADFAICEMGHDEFQRLYEEAKEELNRIEFPEEEEESWSDEELLSMEDIEDAEDPAENEEQEEAENTEAHGASGRA